MDDLVLHYGTDALALREGVDGHALREAVTDALRSGEITWIEVELAGDGAGWFCVVPGISIWIESRPAEQVSVPRRVR